MIQNNMVFYFCLRYTRIYFGTQRQFHGHLQRLCNQLTPGHGLLVACTVKLILQISTNYLADAMGNPMIWWYGDIYIYIHTIYIYIRIYIYIYISLSLSPCTCHPAPAPVASPAPCTPPIPRDSVPFGPSLVEKAWWNGSGADVHPGKVVIFPDMTWENVGTQWFNEFSKEHGFKNIGVIGITICSDWSTQEQWWLNGDDWKLAHLVGSFGAEIHDDFPCCKQLNS